MTHPILRTVNFTVDGSVDAEATVQFKSRNVAISIMPDDQPFETTLQLAADIIKELEMFVPIALTIAARDLLEVYNSGWNEYDEVQEDGSLKTVLNPELTQSEFENRLSLSAIHVIGADSVDFFFDDGGLFWGHYIVVESFQGSNLSDAHAQLIG